MKFTLAVLSQAPVALLIALTTALYWLPKEAWSTQ